MDRSVMHFILFCSVLATVGGATSQKYCGGDPADLVFIMDSSGSIGTEDFLKQTEFIKDMVDLFEIDNGKIRVGVVAYSNWAFLEFHLNTYSNKTLINSAIDRVRHYRGDTNTGAALNYMREVMFDMYNGARDGVPHIAIILTDGHSNDPKVTIEEAMAAKRDNIAVFAIGVGHDISNYELKMIANEPEERFVFKVSNYIALQYIKEMLAIKACEVPAPPRMYPTTPPIITETTQPQFACKDTSLADIVYALAPAATSDAVEKSLHFFRQITSGLDLTEDKIRIGMVPKDCGAVPEVYIRNDESKNSVLSELDKLIASEPTLTDVIRYMRRKSFSENAGSRPDAKHIGILFVDEGDDLVRTKAEARRAREANNIELYVIAVGRTLDEGKLRKIASKPHESHLFMVRSYDHLPPILNLVRDSVCPPP